MRPLMMSASGIRGVVGESLHPTVGIQTAMAFGAFLGKGPVVLGGDTRVSYTMLKSAVISGLLAVGIDVIDIGQVTTPTVQQMIRHHQATGGIVITASHNPIIWNGIKLMNQSGSFLSMDEFARFKALYDQPSTIPLVPWEQLGRLSLDAHALERHVDIICTVLDVESIKESGLRVLVDTNNGAGCLANPILFEKLGVEYTMLNGKPSGMFAHDPEPLKTNLSGLIEEMKTGQYDIGFAQDADADRLVIVDEAGRFIGEDYSLGFCIDYVLGIEDAARKSVVVNLSTSNVIEAIAKKHGANVIYTAIGETNVTQAIKDSKATVGGEGNGGIIYPKVGWGRDSLVGITLALKSLAESKKTVSQIVSEYPQYILLREKIAVSSKEEVENALQKIDAGFSGVEKNRIDGIKMTFDDSWIHVRPSNTEPIIRIFVEAPTEAEARALFERVQAVI